MGRLAVAALGAALLLTGCGERSEPIASAPVTYPLSAGTVTLEAAPASVRGSDAMAPLLDELGAAQGEGDAELYLRWEVDSEAGAPPGAAVYVARADTLDDVVAAIGQIGLLLGRPERARAIISGIQSTRERVRKAITGREPVRVFVDLGFYATAGERTLIGDMIREAGGANVAGVTPEPGPFPLRQLAEANPQVYVLTSSSRTRADDLRSNRRTRGIAAVANNRIVVVADEWLQPGPRVGEGLLALTRALHGEDVP